MGELMGSKVPPHRPHPDGSTVNSARRLWHMATAVADPSTGRWSALVVNLAHPELGPTTQLSMNDNTDQETRTGA